MTSHLFTCWLALENDWHHTTITLKMLGAKNSIFPGVVRLSNPWLLGIILPEPSFRLWPFRSHGISSSFPGLSKMNISCWETLLLRSLGMLGPVDFWSILCPFRLLEYGKVHQHLNVMQEGCFPGLPIKNLCMSPLLLTMLSSPSSNWILPPAHAVVPSDFRRESSEAQTLLSFLFPNILLIWAVSLFFILFFSTSTLISDWLKVHPSSEAFHLLFSWCLRQGHQGRSNTRKMSHVKSLKHPRILY